MKKFSEWPGVLQGVTSVAAVIFVFVVGLLGLQLLFHLMTWWDAFLKARLG